MNLGLVRKMTLSLVNRRKGSLTVNAYISTFILADVSTRRSAVFQEMNFRCALWIDSKGGMTQDNIKFP